MRASLSLSMLGGLAAVALGVVITANSEPAAAQQRPQQPMGREQGRPQHRLARKTAAQYKQWASKARDEIQASPEDKTAWVAAVRAKDPTAIKAILQKHGGPSEALKGASIIFVDTTGGRSGEPGMFPVLRVSITIYLRNPLQVKADLE